MGSLPCSQAPSAYDLDAVLPSGPQLLPEAVEYPPKSVECNSRHRKGSLPRGSITLLQKIFASIITSWHPVKQAHQSASCGDSTVPSSGSTAGSCGRSSGRRSVRSNGTPALQRNTVLKRLTMFKRGISAAQGTVNSVDMVLVVVVDLVLAA